jgi:hypothetical protein
VITLQRWSLLKCIDLERTDILWNRQTKLSEIQGNNDKHLIEIWKMRHGQKEKFLNRIEIMKNNEIEILN